MNDQPRDEDLSPLAKVMKAQELRGFICQLKSMRIYSPSDEWDRDAEALIVQFTAQADALEGRISTSARPSNE